MTTEFTQHHKKSYPDESYDALLKRTLASYHAAEKRRARLRIIGYTSAALAAIAIWSWFAYLLWPYMLEAFQ